MRQRRVLRGLAILLGLALVAAACGDDDDSTSSDTTEADGGGAAATDFTACQVTDTGGVDDRSFNQTAYAGVQDAADELGFEPSVLESQAEADFAPNIQTLHRPGLRPDRHGRIPARRRHGRLPPTANPDQNFAIVDYDFSTAAGDAQDEFDNVKELTFSTDQAAFLAGYVAAAMTETGNGRHLRGHQHPHRDHLHEGLPGSASRTTTRTTARTSSWWAGTTPPTTACSPATSRTRPTAGPPPRRSSTTAPTSSCRWPGRWAWARSRRSAPDPAAMPRLIWVDTDGCVSVADDCDLFLTSVMKNMDVAVHDATLEAAEGNFEGGLYTGTLENEGVALAPFNEFEDQVPDEREDRGRRPAPADHRRRGHHDAGRLTG